MNLAQQVDHLFATSSVADIDALLKKANFDHFNAVGGDILSPEQALQQAEVVRNTFSSTLIAEYTPENSERAWFFVAMDMSREALFTISGDHSVLIDSLYGVPLTTANCGFEAGKTEEAPLAA